MEKLILEMELIKFCMEEEGTTETEKLYIIKQIIDRTLKGK